MTSDRTISADLASREAVIDRGLAAFIAYADAIRALRGLPRCRDIDEALTEYETHQRLTR